MPTGEELEALIRLCARTKQILSGTYVDRNKMYDDEEIVWEYTRKVIELKQKNRERAKKWNKEHPERHSEINKKYIERKKNGR